MRCGKQLILATKEFARDNRARSWWLMLSSGLLLILALMGTLWNVHLAAKIGCSLLSGLILVRVFVIYHDHQHKAILTRSRLADWLMKAFGLFVLTPSSIWRASHDHHHHHNSKLRGSSFGSFPVTTKEGYLSMSRTERFQYLFVRHPLTLLFGYITVFMVGMSLMPFLGRPRRHFDGFLALALHAGLATVLLVWAGWLALLLFLIAPCFISSAIGSYLFYAQHNFPDVFYMDKDGWTYEGAAMESSSYFKMGPLMSWFTGNIGYHHIHHLNARIPFYRLPEIMKKMPELQAPKTTSLKLAEIYRCLRLKVWDVQAQRMVGLAEVRSTATG